MPRTSTLTIAGALLLLSAILAILLTGVVRKARLDASGRELAIAVTEAVFTDGAAALIEHAHARMLAEQSPRQLTGYINFANRTLGALDRIESITGESRVPLLPLGGAPATADYVLRLQFADSEADLEIALSREQARWLITGFVIQAEALFE